MEIMKISELIEQACTNCILEIKCPECGATIIAEPDTEDLYCEECKRIVLQNPLIESGLI